MTDEQLQRVCALSADSHSKRLKYQELAGMEVKSLSPDKLRKQDAAYLMAQTDWQESCTLLNKVRHEISKT